MKDWSTLEGVAQKEALLNELKGNIFEFLLASILARSYKHESSFLMHFTALDGGKVHEDFNRYQSYLLENDRHLYLQLPVLAQKAATFLEEQTSFFNDFRPRETLLLGKWASSFSEGNQLKESDLVFIDEKKEAKGLSLKLCKSGAFVNTKSGGIRSFIHKYFASFDDALTFQEDLNECLDQSFAQMRSECYQWADLESVDDDSSRTHFDQRWSDKGLPVLPGQLPDELRALVHSHYQRIIEKLYKSLKSFWLQDKENFLDCLLSLVGLGSKEISQLTCFHHGLKGERYLLDHFEFFNRDEFFKSLVKLNWPQLKEGISSFELKLGPKILQIRVKPMNTFIVSGLKVNCSVKSFKKHEV